MTETKVDEKILALLKAVKANDVEAVKAELENGVRNLSLHVLKKFCELPLRL